MATEIAIRKTIKPEEVNGEAASARFVLAQSHELGFAHLKGDDWPAVPDLRGTEVGA